MRRLAGEILRLPGFWINAISTSEEGLSIDRVSYGSNPRQYFLCCFTAKPVKACLLYFHGGGWRFGSPERFLKHARLLNDMGYVVFLPAYRRIPRYDYRHIREDLSAMMERIKAYQAQHHLPEKIIAGGMSAGGNLAAHLVFDHSLHEKPPGFAGAFLFGAPLELNTMPLSPIILSYAGMPGSDKFRSANPINYLDKKANTSTLIIQGKKDGMVPHEAVTPFAERLENVNQSATQYALLPEETHLGVASWVFMENEVRQIFFEWLEGV